MACIPMIMEDQNTVPSVTVLPASADAVNCQAAKEVHSSNRFGQNMVSEKETLFPKQDQEDWMPISSEMLENEQHCQSNLLSSAPASCNLMGKASMIVKECREAWRRLELERSTMLSWTGECPPLEPMTSTSSGMNHHCSDFSTHSGNLPSLTKTPGSMNWMIPKYFPVWMKSTAAPPAEIPTSSLEESTPYMYILPDYLDRAKEICVVQEEFADMGRPSPQEDLWNDTSPNNTKDGRLLGATLMAANTRFAGSRGFKVLKDIYKDGTEGNNIMSRSKNTFKASTMIAVRVTQALVRNVDLSLRSTHVAI